MRNIFKGQTRLLICGLALLLTATCFASHVTEPAYIDASGGLPQNSLRALLVDRDNYLWVGTERGLARFDGHRFINFSETDDRIPVDVLISIHQDSHGRIWTNWYKNNPRVILPDRSQVIEIQPRDGLETDLVESVNLIYEDPQGTVWFNGFRSLYWMDPDGTWDSIALDEPVIPRLVGIGHRVFFGKANGIHVTDTRQRPVHSEVIPLPPQPAGNTSLPSANVAHLRTWRDSLVVCAPGGVYLLKPDSTEMEWVYSTGSAFIRECRTQGPLLYMSLSYANGLEHELLALNLESRLLEKPDEGLPDKGFLANAFTDSSGGDWLVIGGELYARPGGEDHFDHVALEASIFGVMSTLAESHGGEMWIATDGAGLAQIAPHRKKFTTVAPPGRASGVSSPKVRRMAEDAQGRLWMGTDEFGINSWDRSSNQWRQYEADNGYPIKELVSLTDGSVYACNDHDQELIRYSPAQDRFERVMALPMYYCKLFAQEDGQLLVASGTDFMRFDPLSGRSTRLNQDDLPAPVRALTVDRQGTPWFGMHGKGLLRLDKNGTLGSWTTRSSGLTSDQIFSLQFDAEGMLWIGTWHGGLLRFDPLTEQFEPYGPEQGLPDSTIFGILIDNDQVLWLSTYSGLVRFRPCHSPRCIPDVHVFNRLDGLQGDEFDAESFYRSPKGELFFGGSRGFNAFFPRDIHLNTQVPAIAITRAMLNGGPLPGSESVYQVPAATTLPYNAGEIRIELSSLDYNAPGNNRYQYRSTASGHEWIGLDGPELVLRGLPEGARSLEFRGSNNDGLWSESTARLDLVVTPPWYRTPAMMALYAVLLVLIPLLYFRRRQARLVEVGERLEQQVRERTLELERASSARERFFANVSHEIAAPLHMILLMLEQQRQHDKGESGLYQSATGYAAQLLAYLRQLVEGARSLEADSRLYRADMETMINGLLQVNRPVASARKIRLNIGTLQSGQVAVYRHSPAGIFSNLLFNALIYTPSDGEIEIRGECREDDYRLVIENTLHPDYSVDLEEAMERGQRGGFDSTAFGGHGLGLSIVTESVESLDGHVWRQTVDGRILFSIDLPLAGTDLSILPDPADFSLSKEQQLAIDAIDPVASVAVNTRGKASGRKILIIEDDQNVAHLLAALLEEDNSVSTAANAAEGISLARSRLPDVILCDLFLPDENGFEVLRAVRKNRMTMDTLFVMITASISETDRETGLRLGVDHFINKPVSAETIKWVIHNHENLERQRSQSRRQEELRQKARLGVSAVEPGDFETSWESVLEELFTDPATTIEDFQVRLSLSYSVLIRHCREHFGKTPKRLLVEKRIEKARELLVSTNYKVGLIAEMTGFSSHAQFATTFKKETGKSPAEFRKKSGKRRR